ncbi:patatin-like phospholipase family protein [Dactylosporangium matsuzakiense]|uniref:Patatin n=1 Tax=Dactylosporangium matsuzakiense TaxID=53360 RepID=A0A9W6NPF5_9ACTN|nr:patatin-like phospholipase family protein [Dactylosporangium matsuzakiense]UWZ46899.1 patatin-like phospholipase family protein [Dactylosporangium matsuzakiense]GLL04211.1 patatin [Dactylosporangium matsuzakiense]
MPEVLGPVGFVFGGGGVLGAYEVGMVRAVLHHGIRPDFVIGTSIGALNGAAVAAAPDEHVAARLTEMWASPQARTVYGDSLPRQLGRFARSTHLHSPDPLRRMLEYHLGADTTFADLAVPFQCCAASIERAAEHWFSSGPLIDAVLASSAVPGLLPPVHLGDEHFIDGGIVNSVPVGRAVTLGARTVFVMQVGRVERPLRPPRRPWEVAQVAFEVARRHRFAREMAETPDGVTVHVLPTGGGSAKDDSPLSYRRIELARGRIERAYEATCAYLEALD